MPSYLLSILLTLVSFTVENKSSVSVSGVAPMGSSATYENTYKKGQLTAGNSATLTLSGWQETLLNEVTLYMHSNKSSGAGTLDISIDGHTVYTIGNYGFNSPYWNDSYSTEDVPITIAWEPYMDVRQGDISIRIEATENSLYISRYDLNYNTAAKRAYTVTLMSSVGGCVSELKESAIGSGITLPHIDWQQEGWHFAGWSTEDIRETKGVPDLMIAGKTYYPTSDVTLYAIFTNVNEDVRICATDELHSGKYIIMHSASPLLVTSEGEEEVLTYYSTSSEYISETENQICYSGDIPQDAVFQLHLAGDSICYLYDYMGLPVGQQGGNICTEEKPWTLRRTAPYLWQILSTENEHTYYLALRTWKSPGSGEEILVFKPEEQTNLAVSFLLFNVDELFKESIYSSTPTRYTQSVEETHAGARTKEVRIPLGIWDLLIKDGRKYLIAR